MKFFHRHQTFEKLHFIYNPKKYMASLSEILYNILEKFNRPREEVNIKPNTFIIINYSGNKYTFPVQSIKLLNHVQYLIITNKEILVDDNKNYDKIESKNKYKNRILLNNIDFHINKYNLLEEPKKPKKSSINNKTKINQIITKNNIIIEEENKILKDFKSIFNYSSESDKTSSYNSNTSSDDLSDKDLLYLFK